MTSKLKEDYFMQPESYIKYNLEIRQKIWEWGQYCINVYDSPQMC